MIFVPATSLEDWKARLSSADGEWQPGSSAHELAARWSQRTTFPPEIAALFDGVERDAERDAPSRTPRTPGPARRRSTCVTDRPLDPGADDAWAPVGGRRRNSERIVRSCDR